MCCIACALKRLRTGLFGVNPSLCCVWLYLALESVERVWSVHRAPPFYISSSGGCTPRATRAMARGSAQKIVEEDKKIAEEE